jgi:hypothetical protein
MPLLVFVPFIALALSVLGQIVLTRRLRRILQHDHPEAWRALSPGSALRDKDVLRFALRRRDKVFNDPALARVTGWIRTLQFIAIGALLVYGVTLFATVGIART